MKIDKAEAVARAADWIAWNDEPEELRAREVEGFISTQVAAHALGITARSLADRIVRMRKEENA